MFSEHDNRVVDHNPSGRDMAAIRATKVAMEVGMAMGSDEREFRQFAPKKGRDHDGREDDTAQHQVLRWNRPLRMRAGRVADNLGRPVSLYGAQQGGLQLFQTLNVRTPWLPCSRQLLAPRE